MGLALFGGAFLFLGLLGTVLEGHFGTWDSLHTLCPPLPLLCGTHACPNTCAPACLPTARQALIVHTHHAHLSHSAMLHFPRHSPFPRLLAGMMSCVNHHVCVSSLSISSIVPFNDIYLSHHHLIINQTTGMTPSGFTHALFTWLEPPLHAENFTPTHFVFLVVFGHMRFVAHFCVCIFILLYARIFFLYFYRRLLCWLQLPRAHTRRRFAFWFGFQRFFSVAWPKLSFTREKEKE